MSIDAAVLSPGIRGDLPCKVNPDVLTVTFSPKDSNRLIRLRYTLNLKLEPVVWQALAIPFPSAPLTAGRLATHVPKRFAPAKIETRTGSLRLSWHAHPDK